MNNQRQKRTYLLSPLTPIQSGLAAFSLEKSKNFCNRIPTPA
ncbi:hypothetical protein LT85_4427 [Collimonas arenae]|uniref:Uncharacterized protein n=1 Tax=Collimonas arenae TaxID=279058 RepID=A0A0A1FIP9_9BURK|nr:hypothetical protein LT85_4427 [Collimonas arenae]